MNCDSADSLTTPRDGVYFVGVAAKMMAYAEEGMLVVSVLIEEVSIVLERCFYWNHSTSLSYFG